MVGNPSLTTLVEAWPDILGPKRRFFGFLGLRSGGVNTEV
jgi:hypothetical protein